MSLTLWGGRRKIGKQKKTAKLVKKKEKKKKEKEKEREEKEKRK